MKTERLLRASAILVLVGLAIELGSLTWSHPLAFLLFIVLGGAALVPGILLYLYWLVARRPEEATAEAKQS